MDTRYTKPSAWLKERLVSFYKENLFLWFDKSGWLSSELGDLLKLCVSLKIKGLDSVAKPFKQMQPITAPKFFHDTKCFHSK
ncbi:DUF3820 family protein [Vibrio parahaemolyticus]|nr:hypothetical protein [Vibrio parahaemolyticus]EHH1281176.1 hypothetical protein [Vibrio parahaemolyticus]EIZ1340287.1 DUF3820 family protein [Vibrio parahaemolyticus]HAS6940976.1 hypothetical protein [Vibrio parahaemolyticus]